jgi:hypothetical protein
MFLLRFSRPLELLFGLFVLVDIPHLLHPLISQMGVS